MSPGVSPSQIPGGIYASCDGETISSAPARASSSDSSRIVSSACGGDSTHSVGDGYSWGPRSGISHDMSSRDVPSLPVDALDSNNLFTGVETPMATTRGRNNRAFTRRDESAYRNDEVFSRHDGSAGFGSFSKTDGAEPQSGGGNIVSTNLEAAKNDECNGEKQCTNSVFISPVSAPSDRDSAREISLTPSPPTRSQPELSQEISWHQQYKYQ